MSDYLATAVTSKSKNSCLCMQNFAIFEYNKNTYMITSSYVNRENTSGKTVQHVRLQLLKYDSEKNIFLFTIPKDGVREDIEQVLCCGHGNNIEVVKYNGKYYCLYVEETEENKAKYVVCNSFVINEDDKGYRWKLGNLTRLTLFPDYSDIPINQCLLAASENHICVTCSYGETMRTDTERYLIYKKNDFLALLTAKDRSQAALNGCRVATGMFTGSNSIGMNIPKNKVVIQSLGLGDDTDTNRVIIFGAVDDRTIGDNHDGRMIHQINRACLNLKTAGSDAALKAQDPASVRCYYSPVNTLKYGETTISMNYKNDKPQEPTDAEKMRFELEGIKRVLNSGTPKIPNGWYISVYNSYLASIQNKNPVGIEAILWNQQIYKPTGTPTIVWKPST